MSIDVSHRSRVPRGVRHGGEFSTEARTESSVTLTTAVADNPFTARYDTLDEKIRAFHDELEAQVSSLDTDENWLAYLDTAAKFHHYSGGGVGIFERRECSPTRANAAIEMPWARTGVQVQGASSPGI